MNIALKGLATIALFAVLGLFSLAMRAPQRLVFPGSGFVDANAGQVDRHIADMDQSEAEVQQVQMQQVQMQQAQMQQITKFANVGMERDRWRNVDDNVMGGISQGSIDFTEQNTAVFSGTLSLENNGGFSSVRRNVEEIDLSEASGLSLRVKGDGRCYQLRVHTADAAQISYRAEFKTTAGEWQMVQFPFSAFEPVFRGRIVSDAPALNSAAVEQIGFLIADGKASEFELEVDWIQSVKSVEE